MSNLKSNGEDQNERARTPQQENAQLREKLREAETERDQYLKMVHTWAKATFTEEELKQWERDDDHGDGRTLLDIIAEVQKEPS